ncbi:MAG TPA: DUF1190 domain-containing protein [Microvirga sp.]|jgi:uncharacterized protein YgiB involved in biofilm formation|nr:DUF1190 domain-containing protein [Microvirga sp.]
MAALARLSFSLLRHGASGVAAAGILLANGAAMAQSGRVLTYATQHTCSVGGVLSLEECQRAFRNATAEFDEKAPRFAKRAECEAHFQRCMVGYSGSGLDRRGVYFLPQMRGVRVVINLRDRTVVPLPQVEHPAIAFAARTLLRADEGQSSQRRTEAQARWDRRDEAPADDAAGVPVDVEADPAPAKPGEITSWPIPAHRRPKLIESP